MRSLLIVLLLAGAIYAQKNVVAVYDTKQLFGAVNNFLGTTQTILLDANKRYYMNFATGDTIYTREFTDPGVGNERIEILADTTSGTTKIYVDLGMKVGEFGTAARSYRYTNLDSIVASDDGVSHAILLNSGNFTPTYDSPGNSFHLRFRMPSTQANRLYVNFIRLLEN